MGPSHIINIKKEKRETDEETKQILRMLEKDDVGASSLGAGFCVAAKGLLGRQARDIFKLLVTGALWGWGCSSVENVFASVCETYTYKEKRHKS